MTPKTKVILAILALSTTFAFGRFSAPTKVVTETKLVEVEKKTSESDSERDKHKTTTTTETTKPDGTKETTTTTTEDSATKKETSSTDDTSKTSDTIKTAENDSGRVNISLLGGLTRDPEPVYGLHVSARVLGPITAGIWGMTNRVYGISVGLSF